jgi:hypothetical protein
MILAAYHLADLLTGVMQNFDRRRSLNGTTLSNPDWGNVCKLLLASQKKTSVLAALKLHILK